MTNVTYNMAYAEVLEILKYLPESELRKIPQDEIKFLENNMDKNYKFAIDPEKTLEEQNISRKANAILVVYFKKYFTNDYQKQKLNEILTRNQQIVENEARKKYNLEDIFRKNNNQDLKNLYKSSYCNAFKHFVESGINENRITSSTFNLIVYRSSNKDLNDAYNKNYREYYIHYMVFGKNENRKAY